MENMINKYHRFFSAGQHQKKKTENVFCYKCVKSFTTVTKKALPLRYMIYLSNKGILRDFQMTEMKQNKTIIIKNLFYEYIL